MFKDFQELEAIDSNLSSYFKQFDKAVAWVNAVNNGIAPWIKKNQKALWEVVRYVSVEEGIIDSKLSREKFAKMVETFCGGALDENDNARNIRYSMEQSKWLSALNNIKRLPDSHQVRKHIATIKGFIDGQEPPVEEEPSEPTIVDRLHDYLKSTVMENEDLWPCSKVRVRPDYGGDIHPVIAVETYQNKGFMNQNMPSSIEAYECIDGVLDKDLVNKFAGQYEDYKNIKLYIVSTHGLDNAAFKRVKEKYIGYVRINPKKEMTENCYVLPRSIEDYAMNQYYRDMLLNGAEMDVPMLIMDNGKVSSSLPDVLSARHVAIKKDQVLKVPFLKPEDIDKVANELTSEHVAACMKLLYNIDYLDLFNVRGKMPIDIKLIAEGLGLAIEDKELPTGQLGRIDLLANRVELNNSLTDEHRRRFTLAHELGHYKLHSEHIKKQGGVSFGDTDDTTSTDKKLDKNMIGLEYEKCWFERQANRFASVLLLPEELVRKLFHILYIELVAKPYGDKEGHIYYNTNQRETHETFNNVVGGIAKIMNVSTKAAEIRLKNLGLLIENDDHLPNNFQNKILNAKKLFRMPE